MRGQRIVSSCAVLPTRSSQFCYPALTRAGLRSGALRTVATATENLSGLKPTPRHVLSGAGTGCGKSRNCGFDMDSSGTKVLSE